MSLIMTVIGSTWPPPPRAQEVDQVEGSSACVQCGGEATAPLWWTPPEEADQRQESADNQIAEQHVEQELPVGPPGSVRAASQVGARRLTEEVAKAAARFLQFLQHRCPFQIRPCT